MRPRTSTSTASRATGGERRRCWWMPWRRYEFHPPGRVAREMSVVAVPPEGDRVSFIQLGDAAVPDHHPGEVRAAEPQEHLPLSVCLSVGRLLDAAGLEDVRWDGLYVAMSRSGADACRLEHGMSPLTPQALGSHAVLVAMHPEGMQAVFGEDGTNRLSLAVDSAVLVPPSSSYRPVERDGDPRLLVVVGTRQGADTGHQGPERCAVEVAQDVAAGASAGHEAGTTGDDTEGPTMEGGQEERGRDPGPCEGVEVDVAAHVEVALATIMAMEEDDESPERSTVGEADEEDAGFEILGAREAHEVQQRGTEVADRARPKTGEVETCRHWAQGCCMRADACRFAHPQPPVPQGVPQVLLLILQAVARVGALSLHRSKHHESLMREVVEKALGGGFPAVGYAVTHESTRVWAVAMPCGMAVLLTPFPVVPWRDIVTLPEASLGWVCTWHTHPARMDPHGWQARAVVTYLSWSLPTACVTWTQW